MTGMPKAVFWDMDGTLVDSEPLHTEALEAGMRSFGLTPPPDLHDRVLGKTALQVYAFVCEEFGIAVPFEDWIGRKYLHYLPRAGTLRPRPGAVEIWRELDRLGVPQVVVSNSDRMIVDANLRAVGLTRHGLRTISRNDVRAGKPDPEPFLRAAWLVGVDPQDCAGIDDSVPGINGAVAAGMLALFWPQIDLAPPPGVRHVRDAADLRACLGLRREIEGKAVLEQVS